MAFGVGDDGFRAGPLDLDGSAKAPGRQGQNELHRDIFASAKGAADRAVDDPHLLQRQTQRLGDLTLVVVRVLACCHAP